jgi:hypothetical protein
LLTYFVISELSGTPLALVSRPSIYKVRMDWVDIVLGSEGDVLYLGNLKGGLSEVPGEGGGSFANFPKPAK